MDGAGTKLKETLEHVHNQQIITNIMSSSEDVNHTVNSINKLLCKVASQCLKQVPANRKTKSKQWFNFSCSELRKEVKSLAKSLCREPSNVYLRSLFFKVKKKYKQMLKHSKLKFKQDLAQKLENASQSDPKSYWKLLEALKQADNRGGNKENPIAPDEWVKHFQELFKPHTPVNTKEEKELLQELEHLENIKVFNELSFRITSDEINIAMSQLKSGKASGPDNISSEIVKASAGTI